MSERTNRKLNDETFSFRQEDYVEMGRMPCDHRTVMMCVRCGRPGATFRLGDRCLCEKCWFKAKHEGAGHAICTNSQGLVVCECHEPR